MEKDIARVIRKRELLNILGISDPTLYRMEKVGRFPKRIQLGGNSVGWFSTEVNQWLEEKSAARSAK